MSAAEKGTFALCIHLIFTLARPLLKRRPMSFFQNRYNRASLFLLVQISTQTCLASLSEPNVETPEIFERPPLVLGQGEQRLLHEPGLTRYSIGGPSVRAHRLESQEALLIKGVQPGNGDLWIWKSDGSSEHRSIRVEKITTGELPSGLEKALSHLEQTEILMAGSGVVLRGEISDLKESARIHGITESFAKDAHDETEPTETLVRDSEKRLNAWIQNNHPGKGLKLEREGKTLWVRGSFERPSLQGAAEKELRRIYPQAVLELDSMPDTSPTVYFRVFLLELKKSRFKTLGLVWPSLQASAFRVTTSALQDALSLDLTLNALEGEGSLKILSNPELVVRAPGEAELFAGGEIPIQAKSHFYSNVTWKPYGLTLHLKVLQSSGERVRLEIFTEVSHLDTALSQDSIPGIQTNRMKTQVDARYGTPLLLSGLLQDHMRDHNQGLPFLRNIPVFGALFGSEDYLHERSELVAILLPASAPPSNPMERLNRLTPRGPSPPPRNWTSPEQERALKQSPEWPWNALQ